MRQQGGNCTSRTNWFDLAGTCCSLSEDEPFNALETIEGLLNTEVDDPVFPAYFLEQSDVPSPWNIYCTEAAAYRGGLELDDAVFGSSCTKFWGAHPCFYCDPELPSECEGHNCVGIHLTERHATGAAATPQRGAGAVDCYRTTDPNSLWNCPI